jgi:hypothetical protein
MFVDETEIQQAITRVMNVREDADRALTGVQNDLRDAGAPNGSATRLVLAGCADSWLQESVALSGRILGVAGRLQRTIELYRLLEEDLHGTFDRIERSL